MQTISRFVRTTVLGGVLFLTPIVVIWFILSKADNLAGQALLPLAALIPDSLSSRTTIAAVLEVLLIALACFVAGLFARTMQAQKIVHELEVSVLSNVPGYEYTKQAGASMLGVGETADYPVILANLGGAWRIGVQTDVLGENLVAVFVPNSPTRCRAECSSSPPTACVLLASPLPLRWELSDAAALDRGCCSANWQ